MREKREIVKGATYHVCARINRGEMLFAQSENKYKTMFYDYIHKAHRKYTFQVQNVCIMNNHIHMLVTPGKKSPLSAIMKSILGGFARKYNIINELKGHVWYDRFRSKVVYTMKQFINTFAYISNNPVRAGLVTHPLLYDHNAVAALYSHQETTLTELVSKIVDIENLELRQYYENFLKSFSFEEGKKPNKDIGFIDRKPGRPKTVKEKES